MTPDDDTLTDRQRHERDLLRLRGVETPCRACHGLGTRGYSNGATWRGGMGTAACEVDVCDRCWGSGDEHRHWLDLRVLETDRRHQTEAAAVEMIRARSGVGFDHLGPCFDELAAVLAREERRRKLPAGLAAWSYGAVVRSLASLLRDLRDRAGEAGKGGAR